MSRALGAAAEARAAEFLQQKGYRVVDRNWACRGGEIDLVCLDGDDTLVFVEVRARADARHGTPLETVGDLKRRRLVRAAQIYVHMKGQSERACRFDVVSIVGASTGETIEHVEDAFGAT
ncbi:MAG: YraN family protein [Myxococcales bacterium]|nr:YraN family protein [Myxococcales bacterium]